MGCTHGCGEAQRCTASDTVRSHSQSLLLRLTHKHKSTFSKFYQKMITQQSLTTIMDFFHALCGYCIDPSTLLSPMSKRRCCGDFKAAQQTKPGF